MIIAVAYDEEGYIGEHFGHAERFAFYEYFGSTVDERNMKIVETTGLSGHQDMADLMRENGADAVIVGRMGPEAREALLDYGIVPVVGYTGDASIASDMLVTGQLPIYGEEYSGGGCGGGCGGCGGGCGGHDEGGSCGCGGGCGC